jgi:hypothetical protein
LKGLNNKQLKPPAIRPYTTENLTSRRILIERKQKFLQAETVKLSRHYSYNVDDSKRAVFI